MPIYFNMYYQMHYVYFYVVSIVVFFLHLNMNCNGIYHCLETGVHIQWWELKWEAIWIFTKWNYGWLCLCKFEIYFFLISFDNNNLRNLLNGLKQSILKGQFKKNPVCVINSRFKIMCQVQAHTGRFGHYDVTLMPLGGRRC